MASGACPAVVSPTPNPATPHPMPAGCSQEVEDVRKLCEMRSRGGAGAGGHTAAGMSLEDEALETEATEAIASIMAGDFESDKCRLRVVQNGEWYHELHTHWDKLMQARLLFSEPVTRYVGAVCLCVCVSVSVWHCVALCQCVALCVALCVGCGCVAMRLGLRSLRWCDEFHAPPSTAVAGPT